MIIASSGINVLPPLRSQMPSVTVAAPSVLAAPLGGQIGLSQQWHAGSPSGDKEAQEALAETFLSGAELIAPDLGHQMRQAYGLNSFPQTFADPAADPLKTGLNAVSFVLDQGNAAPEAASVALDLAVWLSDWRKHIPDAIEALLMAGSLSGRAAAPLVEHAGHPVVAAFLRGVAWSLKTAQSVRTTRVTPQDVAMRAQSSGRGPAGEAKMVCAPQQMRIAPPIPAFGPASAGNQIRPLGLQALHISVGPFPRAGHAFQGTSPAWILPRDWPSPLVMPTSPG